jgi:hypothetical protein
MSEILVRWIRDDIGIPQVSSDLEKECANGFVIGKILHKYGLFPELDKLQNKATPEIKLSNFQRLLPAMRALNIRFNSQLANELMTEERGAALNILMQLKTNLVPNKRVQDATHHSVSSKLLKPIRVNHTPKHKNLEDQTFDLMRQLKTSNPKEVGCIALPMGDLSLLYQMNRVLLFRAVSAPAFVAPIRTRSREPTATC